jgi:hypothetical protein
MVTIQTKNLGTVCLKFRHNLPTLKVPETIQQTNCLESMYRHYVRNIKKIPGSTECNVLINVDTERNPELQYFGQTALFDTDPYQKEIGRETALKHALRAAINDRNITSADEREIMAGYYSR